ncbi:MAG: protein kinase [Planctomycetes bacterium]|nr:protein kinase [Planctomycetota bacterium]
MLKASTRLGPYEILAPLGAGGMGEVYRARDPRLDRDVAVKILPPTLAGDPVRVVRFEREARAVASLAHPSIVVLHDVGTQGDLRYVVTELLEGQTLRQRMQSAPLPWRRAAEIGLALAEGLAAAHGKGIVHRDLKPENVFVTVDGRPKVLDFGIARVEWEAEPGLGVTQAGAMLGTIGYMAPEQVRGEMADARSDLFALGVVLHEAASGRHPFVRDMMAATQVAIVHEEAPPLVGAPVPFDRVVRRCLEKEPGARFQTANDLAFALRAVLADTDAAGAVATVVRSESGRRSPATRGVLAFAAVLAAGAAVWFAMRGDGSAPAAPLRIGSIAVLPLIDHGQDANAKVLGAGLSRTIIRSLLELPDVVVRPFSSVAHYGAVDAVDPHEVGRQLDVEAVLAGTIGLTESGPAITVELVDVKHNRSLWLQNYGVRQDPLFVQDDILKEIAQKLGWQLSPAQRERLARRPTQDTNAYLEYLEGLHAIHEWTVDDTKRGIDRLERAIARDPGFALAYASLADAYIAAAYIFMEPRVAFERARKAAVQAMERDPLLAEAHAAIATVQFHVDWDWATAEKGFREALRLNPRCTFALDYFAWYWVARGHGDEAIACLEKAVELEPRSNLFNVDLAFVYQHSRRFDAAEKQAKKTLELDRNSAMAPWAMSLVCAHRDRNYEESLRYAKAFLERDRQRPDAYAMLGWVLGKMGRIDEARQVLAQLDRMPAGVYVRGEVRAWLCAGMGDKDAAFRHLDQILAERSPGVVYIKLDPLFDSLRDDPRYLALLQRIGVAD